ncbi:hypothetical protein [Clostridium botulinum]|uniref:Uncharacterized protein n=1 Tax=Clostridium botulinum (strain Langeland / NCTC 10281 / Type F) TaxID=441772 RepID=A7GIA4_CLOBL|nr:hypothetical protein [Clostridium botulinum]ABS42619.1 hypothetical protein CLI_3302 [Clostridium botulinum F str. Langeland]ADG00879.1 hypothetical protein CBF_3294 [Clostridium botulinum F str. 230613]MBY6794408.1 hypothetical protein [Clostridium botulinum]MBY6938196.1 hypothetical protein [Clostridium botulinum]MBY6944903.1 hypothetical protein [Clostridium botulinum]
MGFKVVVNYPTTEEGKRKLEESQAEAVLTVLNQILTPKQLEKLISRL